MRESHTFCRELFDNHWVINSHRDTHQVFSNLHPSFHKVCSQKIMLNMLFLSAFYFTFLIGDWEISHFLPAEISITRKDMATSPVIPESFRTSALPKIPPLGLPSTPQASRWVKVSLRVLSLVHSCFLWHGLASLYNHLSHPSLSNTTNVFYHTLSVFLDE